MNDIEFLDDLIKQARKIHMRNELTWVSISAQTRLNSLLAEFKFQERVISRVSASWLIHVCTGLRSTVIHQTIKRLTS